MKIKRLNEEVDETKYIYFKEFLYNNYRNQLNEDPFTFLCDLINNSEFEMSRKDRIECLHKLDKEFNLQLSQDDFFNPHYNYGSYYSAQLSVWIDYNPDIKHLTIDLKDLLIPHYLCSGRENLESVDFKYPNEIIDIGPSAFRGCTNLKHIELPTSLICISDRAFQDCVELEEIKIPDSVTEIEAYCFANCRKLKSVNIPEGVTRICENTFESCTKLEYVNIPDSVEKIRHDAFKDCPKLVVHTKNPIAINYCKENNIKYIEE